MFILYVYILFDISICGLRLGDSLYIDITQSIATAVCTWKEIVSSPSKEVFFKYWKYDEY